MTDTRSEIRIMADQLQMKLDKNAPYKAEINEIKINQLLAEMKDSQGSGWSTIREWIARGSEGKI